MYFRVYHFTVPCHTSLLSEKYEDWLPAHVFCTFIPFYIFFMFVLCRTDVFHKCTMQHKSIGSNVSRLIVLMRDCPIAFCWCKYTRSRILTDKNEVYDNCRSAASNSCFYQILEQLTWHGSAISILSYFGFVWDSLIGFRLELANSASLSDLHDLKRTNWTWTLTYSLELQNELQGKTSSEFV